ncbi:PREDICTED: C3 and PZP-like alpha-2-macroglobulin domain-containing protein 8, partial [Nicrophorus vespilloides]|uniref:C3 and PZP-like alpha-2-macroglobulin domain-containing protein 8 n=1 Tax=Nicrophorus vespilloides TaxID=110193 RepID=A0ABM1MDY8_NICVS
AELVSVESKEIESHYVLAREPIHKWNSSSDCYLLIEGVEHTLQPEEEAHVSILSTCPCERDLHYVITTDGRVTDWAQRRYEDPVPVPSPTITQLGSICRLNFSFTVKSVMAPVSQLLVYYITPLGEPVSDVISFDVKLLHRQVYVMMENREWWLPNQPLDLEVIAEPSSLVCLLGGKIGANSDIKFDPRVSEERIPNSETGEVDFLEAGVSFFQRQCIKRDSGMSAVSYRQRGSGAGPASGRRRPPESLVGGAPFDQLWLWKCFNYTSEIASSGMSIMGPQEAGRWSLWALTVSNSGGLQFSAPVALNVFRPLQAEFRLPPTLRVRETLEVDIKIGNNINSCMDITALLALSEGAQFLSNGLLYVTERLRLGPHGATSLVVRLLVTTPGLKNMTVEVNGYSSPSCEGSEGVSNSSLAGAVVRSATVDVRPEGVVRTDTESAYFCANENMLISTSDSFKYEWVGAPRNREGVVIELKAGASKRPGPVHIALANTHYPGDKMYRITVGDSENSISWIGRGKHDYGVQLVTAQTPAVLSQDDWRTFWITWEKSSLEFGRGSLFHNDTLLKWKIDKKLKIQNIGFASSWGSLAEFRVWNFNDESGFSQVLHLDTPRSVVPGSESGELVISGGLALPALPKKHRPSGGLSDTLSSLTTLLSLSHFGLKANESLRESAYSRLPGQIQNLLSFRKLDNSFSEHQLLDSHEATVKVLEALTKIQAHFSIDPELIQSIKRWVQLRQEDDGSFSPLHADVSYPSGNFSRSVLDEVMEMTAETVIVLFEIGVENDVDAETLVKAKVFLENGLPKVQSSEAVAAVALALVLAKSATASWAVERLKNASTTEDGEFGWPHVTPKRDAADWLYESEAGRTLKEPIIATVEDYKASLYALTTFCLIGDLKFAESTAKYLFYRSHMLDKHVELLYDAVKAFARYDTLVDDKRRSLTISLATSGMELTDTLELKPGRSAETILHLPSLPTKVFVYATGAGCATVLGKTTYSSYTAKSSTELLDIWSAVSEEILPDRSSVEEIEGKSPMLKIKTCFRWKHAEKPSGVLRMEVGLFSGFEPTPVPPQVLNEDAGEMQHGHNANNLWFTFANVSGNCPICVQYLAHSIYVISSLRPAHAKIYPAEREDLAAEVFFHTQSDSSLLKGITGDDLITWFGKNSTVGPEVKVPCTCKDACTQKTQVPELKEDLSVTTYTINVDSNSISNLSHVDRFLIEPTAVAANTSEIPTNDTTIIFTKTSDDLILQENLIDVQGETQLESFVKSTQLPKKVYEREIKKVTKPQKKKVTEVNNNTVFVTTTTTTVEVTSEAEEVNITDFANYTTSEVSVTTELETTSKLNNVENQLIVDLNVSPPKHVNTEKLQIPDDLYEKRDEEVSEEPATFAPENKNDKYVLLDKEDLWGMLKEVVDDEIKKKSKIAQQLRKQGFS